MDDYPYPVVEENTRAGRMCDEVLEILRETRTNYGHTGDGVFLNDRAYISNPLFPRDVNNAFRKLITNKFWKFHEIVTACDAGSAVAALADDALSDFLRSAPGNVQDGGFFIIEAEKTVFWCRTTFIHIKMIYGAIGDDDVKAELRSLIEDLFAISQVFATNSVHLPRFMQVADLSRMTFE